VRVRACVCVCIYWRNYFEATDLRLLLLMCSLACSYWRNYFEATDGMVWVVDSADRRRLGDCAEELANLLVRHI
jgi:hypothetical protein